MIRYALVDGEIREPTSGLKGVCPGCGTKLTAKCGSLRIHHWAHQRRIDCDPWWEPMTQWHIDWQNKFPAAWREVIFRDEESGEFHRADIYTPQGLTIEFQYSPLSKEELESRNSFYKKIIWVVNAQRLKEQFTFEKSIPNPASPLLAGYNFGVFPDGLAKHALFYLKEELSAHGPAVRIYSLQDDELKEVSNDYDKAQKLYWLFS